MYTCDCGTETFDPGLCDECYRISREHRLAGHKPMGLDLPLSNLFEAISHRILQQALDVVCRYKTSGITKIYVDSSRMHFWFYLPKPAPGQIDEAFSLAQKVLSNLGAIEKHPWLYGGLTYKEPHGTNFLCGEVNPQRSQCKVYPLTEEQQQSLQVDLSGIKPC